MHIFSVFGKPSPSGRYVINSFPKSGTHLLARVFDLLGFRNHADLTLTYGQFACQQSNPEVSNSSDQQLPVGVTRTMQVRKSELCRLLDRVRPGRYVLGHLPFHHVWLPLLAEFGFGIVTIVRDPRDAVLSDIDAVLKNPDHWLHRHFRQLQSREERIAAMIEGVFVGNADNAQRLEPLGTRIHKVLPWLDVSGACVRFEDLVGPKGGGDAASQHRVLSRLTRIVDPAGNRTPNTSRIARQLFGKGSKTFNRGQLGRWRREFTAAQQADWDAALGDVTLRLGYPLAQAKTSALASRTSLAG